MEGAASGTAKAVLNSDGESLQYVRFFVTAMAYYDFFVHPRFPRIRHSPHLHPASVPSYPHYDADDAAAWVFKKTAKQWPQKGMLRSGFGTLRLNLCTFTRLQAIDASVSHGAPVAGSVCA